MKKILWFCFILGLLFLPFALYKVFSSKRTLYVYSWSAYIKPEILERFQREYNCSVVLDTYDSNEAMYTKLKLGGSGYDILFPSNYFLETMVKDGMLLELDEQKLPNTKYIDWPFLKKLQLSKNAYGAPFIASFSGIAWRKDRLPHAPTSWAIFGDDHLRRRMTMMNDMRETLGAALLYLGYSANSMDTKEIEQARDQVKAWKKNIVKLESEQYKNGIANGEYLVVHGYSGDCLQVARNTTTIGFSFPKEGGTASIDYVAIMKSSHDKDLAHAFINFLYDPQNAAENMANTYYRCLNSKAKNFLPIDLQSSPLLYPETDPSVRFECLRAVGTARKQYVKAWDSIKESH